MARQNEDDTRAQLFQLLLEKIDEDQYPSITMLDMIEEIVTPEEMPAYAEVLMSKVRDEQYPSMSMIRRVMTLS